MICERLGYKNKRAKASGKMRFMQPDKLAASVNYIISCDPKSQGYQPGERTALVNAFSILPPMPGDNHQAYAETFTDALYRWTQRYRVNKPSPADVAINRVISFSPEDKLSVDQVMAISIEAVESVMGPLDHRLAVLSVHTDTDHHHVHVLASTVNTQGQVFNPSFDDGLWNQALDDLERKYSLKPARAENIKEVLKENRLRSPTMLDTQLQRRTNTASYKMKTAEIIDNAIAVANGGFETFLVALLGKKLWPIVNMNTETAPVRGISFDLDGERFSGSSIGRGYSWKSIAQRVGFDANNPDHLELLWDLKRLSEKGDLPATLSPAPVSGRAKKPKKNRPQKKPAKTTANKKLHSCFETQEVNGLTHFYWQSSKKLAIEEEKRKGSHKLKTTYGKNRKCVERMVLRAIELGWTQVRARGSQRYLDLVAEFSHKYGLEVTHQTLHAESRRGLSEQDQQQIRKIAALPKFSNQDNPEQAAFDFFMDRRRNVAKAPVNEGPGMGR